MAAYVRRVRRILRRRRRRNWRSLHWNVPGTVWAIDGTLFDQVIGSNSRRALVVVEMHSHKTLAVESVPGERAGAVVKCLQRLVEVHGAPLVLKLDNGSAFISEALADFCRQHGITLMHSPPWTPRWNGTCEVSCGWAKVRAMEAATRRGSPAAICKEDLDCAVTFRGTLPLISDATRTSFLACVEEQLAAVVAEQGIAPKDLEHDHVRRSLERVAARRALELCHILTIQGREYHQRLPASAA